MAITSKGQLWQKLSRIPWVSNISLEMLYMKIKYIILCDASYATFDTDDLFFRWKTNVLQHTELSLQQ